MIMYLIGVIATIAIIILGYYIVKEDVHGNDITVILFLSAFSWVGFVSTIIVVLIMNIVFLSEEFRNKPIIKWKSREKDTQDNLNIVRKVNINSEQIGLELLGV